MGEEGSVGGGVGDEGNLADVYSQTADDLKEWPVGGGEGDKDGPLAILRCDHAIQEGAEALDDAGKEVRLVWARLPLVADALPATGRLSEVGENLGVAVDAVGGGPRDGMNDGGCTVELHVSHTQADGVAAKRRGEEVPLGAVSAPPVGAGSEGLLGVGGRAGIGAVHGIIHARSSLFMRRR